MAFDDKGQVNIDGSMLPNVVVQLINAAQEEMQAGDQESEARARLHIEAAKVHAICALAASVSIGAVARETLQPDR